MGFYKRNQVHEAIAPIMEFGSVKPSAELRSRIKRLLETDRKLPVDQRANARSAPSAFFSQAAPGRGQENWFSDYEAFALIVGLMLMQHGWTQGFAVKVLRRVRSELEFAYSTTVNHDPTWLFDEAMIRGEAKQGDYVLDNQDPFFLAIVSSARRSDKREDEPFACSVQRGAGEAMKFVWSFRTEGGGFTMFDIVRTAYNLSLRLAQTKPQSRGRT